ncbi:hypothetical protein LJR153_003706 [Paenibacillus sp. LjRoot153]
MVNTEELITHVVHLNKIAEGFKLRNEHKGNTIYVMIDCETKV